MAEENSLLEVSYEIELEHEVFLENDSGVFCLVNITRHAALHVEFLPVEIVVEPEVYDVVWRVDGERED